MTNTSITLSEAEFDDQYPLITNHLNPNATWGTSDSGGCLFETFGDELDFIRQQNPNTVWTLLDGEDGDLFIASGCHFVNRLGYLVSSVPIPEGIDFEVRIPMQKEPDDKCDEPEANRNLTLRTLLEALKDLLGDLPSVQGGMCQHCGREYDYIDSGDCPSDDCPSFKARAALADAGGGGSIDEPEAKLAEIAAMHLGIRTLETRNSDALDFHDIAVWDVKHALAAAFKAGTKAVSTLPKPAAKPRPTVAKPKTKTPLLVAKGTLLAAGKMYLRLYHGRIYPDQELDEWGFAGPTFGPLSCYVHTYCCTFRIFGECDLHEVCLETKDDMIRWEGCFYGDFEVFVAGNDDKA